MIPKVREWKVTMESGTVFRVLAPTRRFARWNLRVHYARVWDHGNVASIGLYRKTTGQRTMVVREK